MKIAGFFIALVLFAFSGSAVPVHDVFVSGQEGYAIYRIPALIATQRDTLLAFAEGRARGHDHAENDIVLKRSTDRGRSWGAMQLIEDGGEDALNNPTAVVVRESSRVLLMYQRYAKGFDEHRAEPGIEGPRVCRTFITHSDDDGITWAKPREITAQVKRPAEVTSTAAGPGIGIQLSKGPHAGRILMPFNQGPFGKWKVYAVISDDQGKTWRYGATAPEGTPGFANEVQFAELADGTVMLNARNQGQGSSKRRKIAFSRDGGETWTETKDDATLIEPICQAALLKSGELLLFSNPATLNARTNGVLRVSRDDGKTWPIQHPIYPGSFAYSSLAALRDGTVLCLFERDSYAMISIAVFPRAKVARNGE
jgi:sialidase-1